MLSRITGYPQLEIQAPQLAAPKVKPVTDSVAALFETSLAESKNDFKLPYAESPPFARYVLAQKGLPSELRDHVMHYVNNANMDIVFPKVDIAEEINHLMTLQTDYVRQTQDISFAEQQRGQMDRMLNLLR